MGVPALEPVAVVVAAVLGRVAVAVAAARMPAWAGPRRSQPSAPDL